MMTPQDIINILANGFFGGDTEFCGLVIFSIIMVAIFVITKRAIVGFITMLPLTLIFKYLGALPDSLMIILIVVSVLGIAIAGRNTAGDGL